MANKWHNGVSEMTSKWHNGVSEMMNKWHNGVSEMTNKWHNGVSEMMSKWHNGVSEITNKWHNGVCNNNYLYMKNKTMTCSICTESFIYSESLTTIYSEHLETIVCLLIRYYINSEFSRSDCIETVIMFTSSIGLITSLLVDELSVFVCLLTWTYAIQLHIRSLWPWLWGQEGWALSSPNLSVLDKLQDDLEYERNLRREKSIFKIHSKTKLT